MRTRQDILDPLCEPYGLLDAVTLAEAKSLAASDVEVALALEQCRRMSAVVEEKVFGLPQTSDAEFLVALRARLDTSSEVRTGPAFGTRRLLAMVATTCMVLMAVVLGSQKWGFPTIGPMPDQMAANFVTSLDESSTINSDSLANEDVDPDTLAAYLDVADLASAYDADDDSDAVLDESITDNLLSLDPQSLAEVLNKLETTNFF
jgi:hypothetical protein